jgi:hypothetical protein
VVIIFGRLIKYFSTVIKAYRNTEVIIGWIRLGKFNQKNYRVTGWVQVNLIRVG